MVLGHSKRRESQASNRSSHDEPREEEDETVVDDDQGNVLSHIISQLRPGADLSRVTLPTFILEPRSMLERITNFMAHPDTLLPMPEIDDPVKRFVAVTKFYLSGWHIKPPGVKKPLNPILGETFTGYWDYPDGTRGYYISEQTSHHPPKSSYFMMAPEHHIRIDGTLKPRSKFLGNSVGSFMEGIAVMRFTNRNNERYFVTQPNMYARGILFGKMKYELGDHAVVKCPETGLEADIEFKVKGWVGGGYNAIGGYIKDSKSGKNLFELSGHWHGEMFIKDLHTGKKELIFDATHARPSYPKARPLQEQHDRESQKLWHATTAAIKKADHKGATDEKSAIEDRQREEAAQREGQEWKPKLFRKALGASGNGGPGDVEGEENLDWVIDAKIDGQTPDEIVKQILAIAPILPGQGSQSTDEKSQPGTPSRAPAQKQQQQTQQTQQPPPQQQQQQPQQSQQPQQPRQQPPPQQQRPAQKDLVDVGQTRSPPAHPEMQNIAPGGGPVNNITSPGISPQQSRTSGSGPAPSVSSGTSTITNKMAGIDLQEPLQPRVHRLSSTDGRDEEFVDAES